MSRENNRCSSFISSFSANVFSTLRFISPRCVSFVSTTVLTSPPRSSSTRIPPHHASTNPGTSSSNATRQPGRRGSLPASSRTSDRSSSHPDTAEHITANENRYSPIDGMILTYSPTFTSMIAIAITSTSSIEYFADHDVTCTILIRNPRGNQCCPPAHNRHSTSFTSGNTMLNTKISPARK